MWTVLTEYGEDTDVLRARDRRIDVRTSRVKLARLLDAPSQGRETATAGTTPVCFLRTSARWVTERRVA
jgi:hypothetical protein